MTDLRAVLRPVSQAMGVFLCVVALSGCQLAEQIRAQSAKPTPIKDADVIVVETETAAPVTPRQPTRATIPAQSTYKLRPGDTVAVFVFDNPDLSQQSTVAPDGRLSYPLAGSFRAEGRTLETVRRILASRFSNSIVAPQVTVSLADIGPSTIYVNGEVAQPGALALDEPITLVQAITRAGGFTAFAQRDKILVYNPTKKDGARRVFNYNAFIASPYLQDVLLQPGDTVIVQ